MSSFSKLTKKNKSKRNNSLQSGEENDNSEDNFYQNKMENNLEEFQYKIPSQKYQVIGQKSPVHLKKRNKNSKIEESLSGDLYEKNNKSKNKKEQLTNKSDNSNENEESQENLYYNKKSKKKSYLKN